ncbi:macro domain-containing protein [Romboutsia sp. 1001216sp1]|uniref:macro domain-containing protein n=1 Tax=Romboutsia sp. 1001216sp1 TaxID=2986997 RepID=UPI00232C524C|nr:macro domain-containing protein [Romboutsia sp. 1001216sp1]MDB8803597.1 macro domain-containing protein [Romboutsia sp. 1001216sp1]MDB8807901.1 macro domain-containing protein [Romboutsia sp. 1001216sp1]MDB8809245.1 macro domain-containing protein [Romboutsia sp. 1001216sp1]MDB8814993.1 macro domain-containing protein [Romboutsia sp. 1001216sp1]MDB8819726.1 macro domain-containing protein [Romboutsia sp. 1001216sp1]
MIEYLDGTVFNSPAKTIVNTVNCAGVMGAGIALEFKLRYPRMYEEYTKQCENKEIKVGIPKIYEHCNDRWIMNFATKGHWRFPSKIQWIESGLKYFAQNYEKRNIESIAFPKLGTHNGGLDWEEVKVLMEKYLGDLNIPVYICLDEKVEAEGTEKYMVDIINATDIMEKYKDIGISKKAAEKITNRLPISRFWHISNIQGITSKAYESIFNYFYKKTDEYLNYNRVNEEIIVQTEQLKLF